MAGECTKHKILCQSKNRRGKLGDRASRSDLRVLKLVRTLHQTKANSSEEWPATTFLRVSWQIYLTLLLSQYHPKPEGKNSEAYGSSSGWPGCPWWRRWSRSQFCASWSLEARRTRRSRWNKIVDPSIALELKVRVIQEATFQRSSNRRWATDLGKPSTPETKITG